MSACNAKGLDDVRSYGYDMQAAVGSVNLGTLRDVEEVVTVLGRLQDRIRVSLLAANNLLECLHECKTICAFDPENKIVNLLEKTESLLITFRDTFIETIEATKIDPVLTGEHKKSVIDEYKTTISLIEDSYEATQDIRWAIMELDAEHADVSGEFNNVDDLIAHLDSL